MNRPLWFWREPSGETVAQFLEEVPQGKYSYAETGASRDNVVAPAGYVVDHNRVKLGEGPAVFAAACAELRAWRMFPGPWTMIFPAKAPIQPGTVVAMQAHALGFWWLNACRIVYVIDEMAPVRRFGFAYGTLEAHVEQGEERFSVELHADGSVWYDLRAFSRPRFWPVRLAKPLARGLQKRFARESLVAMKKAVANP
ncbi:MAG: DUF1990 domain-containing protein [Verrucomicrobia bacterium]|nr:DUF1990 domain-containing protein [Verrucomicrobiota bacterium]